MGRWAYTIPSLPDLFGGVSMETFNQHFIANNEDEAISFELSISNVADNSLVECTTSTDCRI